MSGGSTLQAAGGLDVNELSQKLSTIPPDFSETSSTAAVFGSEADGECVCMLRKNLIIVRQVPYKVTLSPLYCTCSLFL